jgi:hypothetical protein
MKVSATEFVHFFRFSAIAIHSKTGQFRQSVFSPVSAVQNLAIVRLFFVNQLHICHFAIVYVATVPSFGDKAYCIWLKKQTSQHFITRTGNCHRFQEIFYLPDLNEFTSKDLTRLPQHVDVSLAVFFEHAPVIEYFHSVSRTILGIHFFPHHSMRRRRNN